MAAKETQLDRSLSQTDQAIEVAKDAAELAAKLLTERDAARRDRAELIEALRGVEKAWTETATNDKPALRSPLYDAMNRARSLLARMVP